MLEGLLKKIFGDPNEKELKEIGVIVDKINALEKDMVGLSSANLAAKTADFKVRLSKGETLDDIIRHHMLKQLEKHSQLSVKRPNVS